MSDLPKGKHAQIVLSASHLLLKFGGIVALNDVSSLARIMQNRTLWANVPYARFLSRQEIFSSARGRLFQPIG